MATTTKRTWKDKAGGGLKSAWSVSYVDLEGNRHRKQFSKRKDADAFRVDVESQIAKGSFRQSSLTRTVAQAARAYTEKIEARLDEDKIARSYFDTELGYVRNYISCSSGRVAPSVGIGGMKLRQCTSGRIMDYEQRLRGAGVPGTTRRRVLGTLSRIFSHAIGRDEMTFNPLRDLVIEKDGKPSKVTPPSRESLLTLRGYADGRLELEIDFATGTSLRISEQLALKWLDIDFERRLVHVRRSFDRYRKLKKTKTEAGVRSVPLSAKMTAALAEWKRTSPFNRPEDPVFPNSLGAHNSYRNFMRRKFAPLLNRVKQSERDKGREFKHIKWHELRHYGISCWINGGMSPKTVQTYAGHASLQTTMDRYGHLFPSDKHHQIMDDIAQELL